MMKADLRISIKDYPRNNTRRRVALKVYVVLTTGNEAGSAGMQVERPANVQLLAV